MNSFHRGHPRAGRRFSVCLSLSFTSSHHTHKKLSKNFIFFLSCPLSLSREIKMCGIGSVLCRVPAAAATGTTTGAVAATAPDLSPGVLEALARRGPDAVTTAHPPLRDVGLRAWPVTLHLAARMVTWSSSPLRTHVGTGYCERRGVRLRRS